MNSIRSMSVTDSTEPRRDPNALALPELWTRLADGVALRALLELARTEDLGDGDVTSLMAIPADRRAVATMRARRSGIVAGGLATKRVAEVFGVAVDVECRIPDGSEVMPGGEIATLRGTLRDLLAIERTTLNLIGHLCGVATVTRRHVDAVRGTNAIVCDTRKTTPGMRALEKYAVRCGGGTMHRIGLFDAVLLKDNHLAGLDPDGVARLVREVATHARGRVSFIEVEVDSLEQLAALLRLPAESVDIILLDNMRPDALAEAVAMRNAGTACRPLLEASGGISLDAIRMVAETGVDRIAIGALTHSVPALDIGLDVVSIDGRTVSA